MPVLGQNGVQDPSTAASASNPYSSAANSPDANDSVTPDQRSAQAILTSQLAQWGINGLDVDLGNLIKEYGSSNTDAILLNLKNTPAYQQRFAANAARVKAGMGELSPSEYIAAENSYRQVLSQNGIPANYFDSQDELDTYIANNMSPAELNDRAKVAQSIWLGQDQGTKDMWTQMYGLTDGHAIAAILDPDTALPKLQQEAAVSQAGSVAKADGLTADKGRLETYYSQGYTLDQQRQAFSQVGQTLAGDQGMAARFGQQPFTQADSEAGALQGNAQVLKRQQQMYASESALFAGRSAADQNTNNTQQSGSY